MRLHCLHHYPHIHSRLHVQENSAASWMHCLQRKVKRKSGKKVFMLHLSMQRKHHKCKVLKVIEREREKVQKWDSFNFLANIGKMSASCKNFLVAAGKAVWWCLLLEGSASRQNDFIRNVCTAQEADTICNQVKEQRSFESFFLIYF